MRRSIGIIGVGCLVLWQVFASSARAEDQIALPADAKFVVQLDLQALQDTDFGARLFKIIETTLVKELAKESKSGEAPSLEKINDVLGFDPFREVQQFTIAASDYENPEKSLCAIVHLKESTGNLEGLLLALPGYDSDEYRGRQVHSASPDDDMEIFAAIHEGRSRGKRVVFSSDRSTVESLLDHLDGRSRDRDRARVTVFDRGEAIVNLQILDFPQEIGENGPHANVARLLKSMSVRVTEAKDDLDVEIQFAAQKPEQTEQLRQMTQGLVAMFELAASLEPDDQELREFMELAHDVETRKKGDAIQISVKLDSDKLMELIEQELH